MKTLYLECKMGAAGDMLMGALYALLTSGEQNKYLHTINGALSSLLPDSSIRVTGEEKASCGIYGSYMKVLIDGLEEGPEGSHDQEQTEYGHIHHDDREGGHDHESHSHTHDHIHSHHHTSYPEICERIASLSLSDQVKADASTVYRLIGQAEASVHRSDLEHIHFHEVGSLDALADVTGVCLLMEMLKEKYGDLRVICSPVHVGNGTVKCAHGVLPVPAPATAELLKGIPFYSGDIMTELCTPTGAALLRHFADVFGPMPVMTVENTGCGLGTKEFPLLNAVRAFLGETNDAGDRIAMLSCNLDDMTGEDLGFAMNLFMEEGALDVFYTSIMMKKNRPGILLTLLCREDDLDKFQRLIFGHTTTRGIRCQLTDRVKLASTVQTIESPYGPIRIKTSEGFGVSRSKEEYDDLSSLARKHGISLSEIRTSLRRS